MAFSNSDIQNTRTFNINNPQSTSDITIVDTTDYVTPGINPANVTIGIVITGPDGQVFYTNNAAMTGGGTVVVGSLPLDSASAVQKGDYTFAFTYIVAGMVDPGTYTSSVVIDFCEEYPTVAFTWLSNCFCAPIMSLTDATVLGDWTASTRLLTMSPPANAPVNTPYTSAGTTVTSGANSVYGGIWSAALALTVTQTFSDHTTTVDLVGSSLTANSTFTLTCSSTCDVRCCIESQLGRYEAALCVNQFKAQQEWEKLDKMLAYLQLIGNASECGDTADQSTYATKILQLGNCTSSCGDCGGANAGLIDPLCGGAGTTYTFQAGTGLTVNVVGTTVTYSLNSALNTIINNTENVTVASADTSVVVTFVLDNSTSPPTRRYDLSVGYGAISETYDGIVEITFGGAGPIFTKVSETIKGSIPTPVLKTPTYTADNVSGNPSWLNLPACVTISDFYTNATAQDEFKYNIRILKTEYTLIPGLDYCTTPAWYQIDQGDRTPDQVGGNHELRFKFLDQSGVNFSWSNMRSGVSKIIIGVSIVE